MKRTILTTGAAIAGLTLAVEAVAQPRGGPPPRPPVVSAPPRPVTPPVITRPVIATPVSRPPVVTRPLTPPVSAGASAGAAANAAARGQAGRTIGAAMRQGAGVSAGAEASGRGRGLTVRNAVRQAREAGLTGRELGAVASEAGRALRTDGQTELEDALGQADGPQAENGRRAQRRGPENASEQGRAQSNERAGLRSGVDVAGELRSGMRLTDASGRTLGRIVEIVRSSDGLPSGVVVRAPGRGEMTIPIDRVSVDGRIAITSLTATQLRGR